jgi:hypothetical protein
MPFARQYRHDNRGLNHTEVWALDMPYRQWATNALFDRLQYSKLLYSCLYKSSVEGGGCLEPLFFHFPNDTEALQDPEHSFMFAEQIKVTPVITPGKCAAGQTVRSYFPTGRPGSFFGATAAWVNLNNYADIVESSGSWIELTPPCGGELGEQYKWEYTTVMKHLKPGGLIPI